MDDNKKEINSNCDPCLWCCFPCIFTIAVCENCCKAICMFMCCCCIQEEDKIIPKQELTEV